MCVPNILARVFSTVSAGLAVEAVAEEDALPKNGHAAGSKESSRAFDCLRTLFIGIDTRLRCCAN